MKHFGKGATLIRVQKEIMLFQTGLVKWDHGHTIGKTKKKIALQKFQYGYIFQLVCTILLIIRLQHFSINIILSKYLNS